MRSFLILCCFAVLLRANAQKANPSYQFHSLKSWEQASLWITTDPLDQLYVIKDEHSLQKYNALGDLLYEFNENNLGRISHVDASNPMQLLVYYSDFLTVVMLDRTLSEIARWDVGDWDLALFQLDALGISNDNNLWIYDVGAFALRKVNARGEAIITGQELSTLAGQDFQPNFLLESDNQIFLNAPNEGIFVFDNLGNYNKTINIRGLSSFQIFNNQLFFTENGQLKAQHLFSFQTFTIPIPIKDSSPSQICIGPERLYLQYENHIEIFEIKKNKN